MKKNKLILIKLIILILLNIIYSASANQTQLYYLKNEKHDFLFNDFRYDRTQLGEKLWRLYGKTAWVFEKSNQVELNNGLLELYKKKTPEQLKKKSNIHDKNEIKFKNCLFNRGTNKLKLNRDIIMTLSGDTPLYLMTEELFFDGDTFVENKISNIFKYGEYTVNNKGLNYNAHTNILRLLENVVITDKSNNKINATNGLIDVSNNYVRLNEIKRGEYNNYRITANLCEIKNNVVIFSGKVIINDGNYTLTADSVTYDMNKKNIFVSGFFKIANDTVQYQGKNMFAEPEKNIFYSKEKGAVKALKKYAAVFNSINYDSGLLLLKGAVKINNDTYSLTTDELRVKIKDNRNIEKIFTDKHCEIRDNLTSRIINSRGFEALLTAENEITNLDLFKNVSIRADTHTITSDSAYFLFKNNILNHSFFRNNVKYSYADYSLKSQRLDVAFSDNKPVKATVDTGGVTVENDTYILNSDNLNINFQYNNTLTSIASGFDGIIKNGALITDKSNNSVIKSKDAVFSYLNNKFNTLKMMGAVKGILVTQSK